MKANFNPILPYCSLHIPLRSLYCIFNCSDMLLWSTVIQITQIQLSTNTHFWVINWKPHIEFFPERPPCIYALWLTEVKSYNSRTAITHFLTPGTHTLPKITMRIIHPRWYPPTPLAHGLNAIILCIVCCFCIIDEQPQHILCKVLFVLMLLSIWSPLYKLRLGMDK